jgi:hypothetical protein
MLVYPQLITGALSQFPLRKTRRKRTVRNRAADGTEIKLSDPAAETTEWELEYADLNNDEAQALADFFTAAEGTLNGFTFLDPMGNLLASSEHLDAQVWQKDPMLAVAADAGIWRLTNSGAGPQSLSQTLQTPGDYQYCLSAYVRADQEVSVRLIVGEQSAQLPVHGNWARVNLAATGTGGSESVRFGIEIPAETTLQIHSIQAEPQGRASVYKLSTRGGVYSDAHLGSDALELTSTGVNRHSCRVKIIHANHI